MNRQFATLTDGSNCSPETRHRAEMPALTGFPDRKKKKVCQSLLKMHHPKPLSVGMCSNIFIAIGRIANVGVLTKNKSCNN